MELKDDFTNKYFRPDNIKSQMDLINQPTEVDAYADAFNSQANREAKGPAQRNSNALMAGLGAGLKGAANSKRQEQLSPILKMVGELNARSAYLEAQMQQEQQQRMTMVKFLRDNKSAIRDLGNASVANSPEAQEISKYLSNKFEIATGQNPGKFNSFDTKQRKTFYDQPNGSTVGYGFLDAVEPYAEEAYGEETTDILQNLSPFHDKKYKEAEEVRNLKLEKGYADIDNTKAQTSHLGMQDRKIDNEIANPPLTKEEELKQKSNLKVQETAATDNFNYIKNELQPRLDANERLFSVYEELDDIAENNPDIVGSDFATKAWRALAIKFGMDADLDYSKLKSVEFEKNLRPILGAQFGEREGERILGKFASVDNNPDALKRFLKEEIPKTTRSITKDRKYLGLYDKDRASNPFALNLEDGLDDEVTSYLDNRKSKRQQGNMNSSQEYIKVQAPSGRVEEVHIDDIDNLDPNLYKRVE